MHSFASELVHNFVVPFLVRNLSELFLVEEEPVLVKFFVALFDRPDVGHAEFLIQSFGLVLFIMMLVVFSEQIQSP